LSNYIEVSRSVGLDPYRMIDAAGLPRTCLSDPDIKIRMDSVIELLEASAKAAGIDDFALRLAEGRTIANLGPLGLLIREQSTIREALATAIQYMHLHAESVQLRIEEMDEIAIINPVLLSGRSVPARQVVELAVTMVFLILRGLLGNDWKPRAICFTHNAPRDLETHRRVFGPIVEFDSNFDGIICAAFDLEASLPGSDPISARRLQQYLDTLAQHRNPMTPNGIREVVSVMLPAGRCSVDHVAGQLGVTRRTIHRRLAREGQTFSAIVDDVRMELATRYVKNRRRPLDDVAEMLGFSALSAFSRWFRKRFGCTVSAWRTANVGPESRESTELAAN
jgi:AraC-like DNA-binding protein